MTVDLGPRVVIAGVSSGVGKTTVATGLMAALRLAGHRVASAKVGPDYIDPGYHSLATGRPGRNLDSWICGEDAMRPLAGRAGQGADVLVIEGVMGLFDGAAGSGPKASTASIARLLRAPVLLVVDGSGIGQSVAAVVQGYRDYDPRVEIAGVILNRVGSATHGELLKAALMSIGVPVLGAIARDETLSWRDRHLGLVPIAERSLEIGQSIQRLGVVVAAQVDMESIVRIANLAPRMVVDSPPRPEHGGSVRIAVAGGPVFSFVYKDNLDALEAAGAEIVGFDPLSDSALPPCIDALYVGGGFPEVYSQALASNKSLLTDVRNRVDAGLVTWAECGGLLWLARSLDSRLMAGVLDTEAFMTNKLTLGYRVATAHVDNPVLAAGHHIRGHEFHYSKVEPGGDALQLAGTTNKGPVRAGFASSRLLASYLHVHLGGDPSPATRFVATAMASR